MKKLCILSLLLFVNFASTRTVYCDSCYAQIIKSESCLYNTPVSENTFKNVVCMLEQSYYVEIIQDYDEEFYLVNYNGISGYVKRSSVRKVVGIPKEPYPNDISLVTYHKNCYLRLSPEVKDNNISIVPSNYRGLIFIGSTKGEQLEDFGNSTWHYVDYLGTKGYIYDGYVYSIATIFPNEENLKFLQENQFDDVINPLTNMSSTLLIIAMMLPTLIIIFLIYKKPRPKKINLKERVIEIDETDELL